VTEPGNFSYLDLCMHCVRKAVGLGAEWCDVSAGAVRDISVTIEKTGIKTADAGQGEDGQDGRLKGGGHLGADHEAMSVGAVGHNPRRRRGDQRSAAARGFVAGGTRRARTRACGARSDRLTLAGQASRLPGWIDTGDRTGG